MSIFNLICWAIAGILTLVAWERVPRFLYALCWIALMVQLIGRVIAGG